MGEKKKNHRNLWSCIYCGKRYSVDQLEEGNYIEHTKLGDVVECPKCETEQLVER